MTAKVIQCPCGTTLQGVSDDEVVRAAQDHAASVHDMVLTDEQALSMARPA